MKRVVVTAACLLVIVGGVWAGGGRERGAIRRALQPSLEGVLWFDAERGDSAALGQVGVSFSERSGTTTVEIVIPDRTVRTALYRRDNVWFRAFPTHEPLGHQLNIPSFAFEDYSEVYVTPRDPLPVSVEVSSRSGSASFSTSAAWESDGQFDREWTRAGAVNPTFTVPSDGQEHLIEVYVLFEQGSGNQFTRLRFTVGGGLFAGESELFATVGTERTYREKALSLMNRMMSDAPGFAQYVGRLLGDGESASLFSGSAYRDDGQHAELYEQSEAALRASIAAHLESTLDTVFTNTEQEIRLSLPVLSIPENVASTWYGGNRNIYVTLYLSYLTAVGKPATERLLYQTLAGAGIPYNYRDYEPLSEQDGLELAKAALRYLTWGLEYTLVGATDHGGGGLSANARAVFAEAMENEQLRAWISGIGEEYTAGINYAPQELVSDATSVGDAASGSVEELENNPYFQHDASASNAQANVLQGRYTTPFGDGTSGNPVAYAEAGIETPRTFNYKLYEQARAAAYLWLFGYTGQQVLPLDETGALTTALAGRDSYLSPAERWEDARQPGDERDITGSDEELAEAIEPLDVSESMMVKRFEPGNGEGVPWRWNRAGVGNLELLGGSLTMTSWWRESGTRVYGWDNRLVAQPFDAFSSMEPIEDSDYLDREGRPNVLTLEERDALRRSASISRADLERSTVIVPDVSQLRPGDLLVRFYDPRRAERFARFSASDHVTASDAPAPEVAIVVGLGWEDRFEADQPVYGEDVRNWWDQVYVVSANPRFQAVVLASWGDGQTVMSGFSAAPETYQMRRLLVTDGELDDGDANADEWDLLDTRVVALRPEITWEEDPYERARERPGVERHWIPNTEVAPGQFEVLAADDIRIVGITAAGREVGINQPQYGGARVPVRFLSPVDMYADDHDGVEPDSNVYQNKGPGIEVVVDDDRSGSWEVVARFTRIDSPSIVTMPYREVAVADEAWHHWNHHEEGHGLYVSGDQLVFIPEGRPNEHLTRFGVRVIGQARGEEVRPGDDFLLRVGYVRDVSDEDPDWDDTQATAMGTAAPEDFVAVYDKKMLWRANLYIDEGDGVADWNNVHRWSYGNYWNKVHDGQSPITTVEALPTIGDGGQVVTISPWTPIRGTEDAGDSAVAYDYPYSWAATSVWTWDGVPAGTNPFQLDVTHGQDSPFDFNRNMIALRNQMNAYAEAYIAQQTQNGVENPGDHVFAGGVTYSELVDRTETTAPGGEWLSYLNDPDGDDADLYDAAGIDELYVPGMGLFFYDWRIPVESGYARTSGTPRLLRGQGPADNADGLQTTWGVKGQVWADWQDGYTSFGIDLESGDEMLDEYDRPLAIWGSGTDCIGFAQQSASYEGNPYTWPNISRDLTEEAENLQAEPWWRAYPRTEQDAGLRPVYSDLILDRATYETPNADLPALLARIRPGDIMYYSPGHIAIVREVLHNENGEVEDLSSILLIESTWGRDGSDQPYASVTRIRTMAQIHSADPPKAWRLVRLRVQ